MPSFWTDERAKLAKEMLAAGESFHKVAVTVGCSRNAIIGKVKRDGWAHTTASISRRGRNGRRRRFHPPQSSAAAENAPAATAAPPETYPRKSLLELRDGDCKFPLGYPGNPDFCFCAAPAVEMLPYCREHARICYDVNPKRYKFLPLAAHRRRQ